MLRKIKSKMFPTAGAQGTKKKEGRKKLRGV